MGVLPGKLVYATFCDRRGQHGFSQSQLSKVFPDGCEGHEWMIRYEEHGLGVQLFGPYKIYVGRVFHSSATSAKGAYGVLERHGLTLSTNAGSLERD